MTEFSTAERGGKCISNTWSVPYFLQIFRAGADTARQLLGFVSVYLAVFRHVLGSPIFGHTLIRGDALEHFAAM